MFAEVRVFATVAVVIGAASHVDRLADQACAARRGDGQRQRIAPHLAIRMIGADAGGSRAIAEIPGVAQGVARIGWIEGGPGIERDILPDNRLPDVADSRDGVAIGGGLSEHIGLVQHPGREHGRQRRFFRRTGQRQALQNSLLRQGFNLYRDML